ncbi:tRNA-splicing endonuclease subunit [Gnomoniopsis sp. IMI 355080]|nr:tRNA-splicing endonuclease subunit [Gnomoniopsis sp. IMI 355080]
MMSDLVRITSVGGRFLVFEVKDVAALRRDHCICAVFVGTTPQNPNQNVFSGLPIELFAEEAKLLVEKGAAYVVDDGTSHLSQLSSMDRATRLSYLQSLKTRRKLFQKVANEQNEEKRKIGERLKANSLAKKQAKRTAKASQQDPEKRQAPLEPSKATNTEPEQLANDEASFPEDTLFTSASSKDKTSQSRGSANIPMQHITPTTSLDMLADLGAHTISIETPRNYPLYKHLNAKGYYITPGIRFGADYSVYPGDPFRYHAHFMATSYGWNEEIAVLDLVTGGRLGTGVKKGFMIGGAPLQAQEGDDDADRLRAFTIEWAAM